MPFFMGPLGKKDGFFGKMPVGEQQFLAYQGENDQPGPKDVAPNKVEKPKLPDRPVRVIYVDPTTGLPMRSIFSRQPSP